MWEEFGFWMHDNWPRVVLAVCNLIAWSVLIFLIVEIVRWRREDRVGRAEKAADFRPQRYHLWCACTHKIEFTPEGDHTGIYVKCPKCKAEYDGDGVGNWKKHGEEWPPGNHQ